MSYRSNLTFLLVSIAAVCLSIAGLLWVNQRVATTAPGGTDFFVLRNAASSWIFKGVSPYTPSISQDTFRVITGREPVPPSKANRFAYLSPLYSMAFVVPFSFGDWILSRALWMTLIEICIAASAFLAVRLSGWKISLWGSGFVALFAILGYYGLRAIFQGTFSAVAAVLLLASLVLIEKKHDMDAGLVLALASIDLHLSGLLILFTLFWAISSRRSQIPVGILIGLAFLTVSSMVFRPDWPVQWAAVLLSAKSMVLSGSSIISGIASHMPGVSQPVSLVLYGLSGAYLLMEWIMAWGKDEQWYQWTALLTLVMTLLFPLRTTSTDVLVTLPVIFLIYRAWQERWGKTGQVLAWLGLIILLGIGWGLFLATTKSGHESLWMLAIPTLLNLVCLWWVRWWAIHRTRLFFEEFPL